MWKALLLVAAALGFLWYVGSIAQAEPAEPLPEQPTIKSFPMPCFKSDISKELETYEVVFQGVLEGKILYTLYVKDDGQFLMTMQTTIFPDVCAVAAGNQHNLIGITAPRKPEQPESGS
jgi:hypothetical protein